MLSVQNASKSTETERFHIFVLTLLNSLETVAGTSMEAFLPKLVQLVVQSYSKMVSEKVDIKKLLNQTGNAEFSGVFSDMAEEIDCLDFDEYFDYFSSSNYRTRIDRINGIEELRKTFVQAYQAQNMTFLFSALTEEENKKLAEFMRI